MMPWTIDDSRFVYGVGKNDLWFLDITPEGDLCIRLDETEITFPEILDKLRDDLKQAGIDHVPSFTLRVPQLITAQVKKIWGAFEKSILENDYAGDFLLVYPLKVNPMRMVIDTILESHPRYGLESGTKPEFGIILEALKNQQHRLIICNGVKDDEYLEMIGKALFEGYNVFVSIESIEEAQLVLENIHLDHLNLILRVKPYVSLSGYWKASVGRDSKFGLNIEELNQVITMLQEHGASSCLKGLHAHPGSQVQEVNDIFTHVTFLTRLYAELRDQGFTDLHVLNLGGGLPINYDGHLPPETIKTHALTSIRAIMDVLQDDHPHPTIILEAGRAVTALSSMVVVEVLEVKSVYPRKSNKEIQSPLLRKIAQELKKAEHPLEILEAWERLNEHSVIFQMTMNDLLEFEHVVGELKRELRKKFVQHDDWESCYEDDPRAKTLMRPEWLVLGNFTVFNSACDHVLIGQYFPVFPTKNLHVQPETMVRLVDITCDSDGEISVYRPPLSYDLLYTKDGFPLTTENKQTFMGFPVGEVRSLVGSHLVIALVGAYQDVIEFDHNLIGDLPDVELRVTDLGEWHIQWFGQPRGLNGLRKKLGFKVEDKINPYVNKRPKNVNSSQ